MIFIAFVVVVKWISSIMCLVSVIIPIYNVEKYLQKCIESVINQTYKKLEIILIDDGSTDASALICDEYATKDNRIIVIHKDNGGLSEARNFGLDIFTGKYVVFMDSDDWVESDYIESFLKYATEETIVCCRYKYLNKSKTTIVGSEKVLKHTAMEYIDCFQKSYLRAIGWRLKQPYTYVVWNRLYPRKCFDKIRFPLGRLCEDVYVVFEVVLQCKNVVMIPDVTYNHINRSDSITGKITKKLMHDSYEGKLKNEKDLEDLPMLLKNAKKLTLNAALVYLLNHQKGMYELSKDEINMILCVIDDYRNYISFRDLNLLIKYLIISHCGKLMKYLP